MFFLNGKSHYWLVVEPTPLKNMKVSWDHDIPNIIYIYRWKVIIHSCSKPPTSIKKDDFLWYPQWMFILRSDLREKPARITQFCHFFAGLYSESIQNVPRFGGRQQNRESCTSSMGLDLIPDTQNCHSLAGYDISQTIATQIEEASVSFIMFYPFKWHVHKWDILRPIEAPSHQFTLQRSSRIPLPWSCSKSIHVSQWEMPVIFNNHPTLVALDKTKIYDAYIILRFNAFPEVSLVSQSLTIYIIVALTPNQTVGS